MPITFEVDSSEVPARVRVKGDITDNAELLPMLAGLAGRTVLDLQGLTRMNSVGVRQWVRFVHELSPQIDLHLERCPAFFLKQVTMIGNFLGRAKVASVHLPYVCVACDEPTTHLVAASELRPDAPPAVGACPGCQGTLEFDDADDVYRAFVKELAR